MNKDEKQKLGKLKGVMNVVVDRIGGSRNHVIVYPCF